VAATVVLVHGNFLGPWSWKDVVAVLAESGLRAVTVDLPSGNDHSDTAGDLYADSAAVRAVLDDLDDLDGPIVLGGHSYGGAVITDAAAGPAPGVQHLIYLAAAAPDTGQSMASLQPPPPPDQEAGAGEQVTVRPDGRIALTPNAAREALFHDCSAERARAAIDLLRSSSPATGAQPVRGAAWRELPATYVRCRDDRLPELISPAFLTNVVDVVELPTGHCPNWSAPRDVATVVARVAANLR
jgi:pimeloyl-ACP methyl ester carboxylesterase